MRITRPTYELMATIFGGVVLVALVGFSWLPQPCPVIRQALIGCPVKVALFETPQNPHLKELARVPHQSIATDNAYIKLASQDYRKTTIVNFPYQADIANQRVVLKLNTANGYREVAVITDPFVAQLQWANSTEDGFTLFQKTGQLDTVPDFLTHLPPADQLTADSIAADAFHLTPSQYTPLENLTDGSSISYVLTSYQHPQKDGEWSQFEYTVDATDAALVEDGMTMEMEIALSGSAQPFLLGTVHVNYQSMHE